MRCNAFTNLILLALAALNAPAEDAHIQSVLIEPAELVFSTADQSAQLLVTLKMSDGTFRDATHTAQFKFDPKIASIDHGRVMPIADGETAVEATVNGLSCSGKIRVSNFTAKRLVHFANEIEPIFTKVGCNTGGCHGKSGGQNGFALSLLGFDANKDYEALVKEGRGRRLFPAAPAKSLLLCKATGVVAHGGGPRLDPNSREYKLILRWIEQGMPKGKPDDPTIASIEVFPKERLLIDSKQQQLRVVAHYSDNSTEDVTARAEYKSQQPDILKVESNGCATALGVTGEGAIMVRYMGNVDVAHLCIPYSRGLPDSVYAHFKPKNFIDDHVLAKWKKLGIAPSPLCSDEEFIRRASLDLLGVLPTPQDVREFAASQSPLKRDELIARLLERDEYAAYWANFWGDLLRNKREGDEQKRGTFAFSEWIKNSFATNKPYDQFVREILTAQGEVGENPPVNWYRHVRNQTHLVNDSAQLFLGTRVSCANCHNHPYEKMSQDDYWGLAAFFQRVGKKPGDVPADSAVFVQKTGDTYHPRTGKKMVPKGLNGPTYEYVRGEDPRIKFVDWMTAPENPYFAKAIANRLWGQFMGTGLVVAIDDMRITNPPSNPALLDALAQHMCGVKYDLKAYIKTIMTSQVYNLCSLPNPNNATDRQNYARYKPHRIPAEALLDAIGTVTGMPERFFGYPAGTRSMDLPDQATNNYFLTTFGKSMRETACECERSYAPNLSQTLHLMNSPEIQGKIADAKGFLATVVKREPKSDKIVEELFLRALSRFPKPEELRDAVAMLDNSKDKKSALEDLMWVVLNSKEFLFNH